MKGLAAALAASLAALVLTATPADAKARRTVTPIKVITHNIAGGATFDGSTDALNAVEQQIRAYSPDVVLLQEVCYTGQYEPFRQAHPDWTFRFQVSYGSHPGCGGGNLGNVIASPGRLKNSFSAPLPYWSHSREQHFLGADLQLQGRTILVGVAHIKSKGFAEKSEAHEGRPPGTEQAGQIAEVARLAAPYRDRGPVVIGGDWNVPLFSGAIKPMKAQYAEVMGDAGTGGRIEHIWVGGPGVTARGGSLVSGQGSDHRVLRGRFGWGR